MPTFDMTSDDLTPWLANRILSDHFIEERRRAAFLWRHFSAPGLLGGVDLADGTKYTTLRPGYPAIFFLTHTLGPARINNPANVVGTSEDGQEVELASFFRTTTKHFDDDKRCPFLVVRFDSQPSFGPGTEVILASKVLHQSSIPNALERSFQISVWNLWIMFESAVHFEQAKKIGNTIRQSIEAAGVNPTSFRIPLIEGDSSPVYVPYHFFSGDYFGNLHRLNGQGDLVALNPNNIEVMMVADAAVPNAVAVPDGWAKATEPLTSLLDAWYAWKSNRPVRAGELADLVADQGILIPDLVALESRQAKAIGLGHILIEMASNNSIEGWSINVGKSGNSNVFRLEKSA